MLKLEKVAKSRELNATLRNKPSLFSQTFLVALSYALFCHLIALLLFQVAPFKIGYEATIFPPVFVESSSILATLADCKENQLVPEYLIIPKRQQVALPEFPSFTSQPIVDLKEKRGRDPFFNFSQDLDWLFSPNQASLPLISVHASGGLQDSQVIFHEKKARDLIQKFAKQSPFLPSSEPYVFRFSVQVDGRNGKIFWWEFLVNQGKEVQLLAVELLKDLKIKTNDAIGTGIVELTLRITND